MAERISTRTFCNGIAPGTFSTELSRCTTYAEIVNSGTLTIVPEPALSYADTKRCTAEDDLMAAGTDITVHIKNNSSNAATTAGKITLYITGTNGAVYGSSISNLTSAPNVQTVTLSSANEQTITVKVDSNQLISFGFSSPAKKYCQKCYNTTVDESDTHFFVPWQFGIYYEPMYWSNSTETSYDSTYNLYSYYVEDLTKDVYIFLAQKSQVKTSRNVYIKRVQKGTPSTGGIGMIGTLTGATLKNIKINGVTYLTEGAELAPFYATGNEYFVASVPLGVGSGDSLDRSALADVQEASGSMTTSTDRGNGQAIINTTPCSFYFNSECTTQTYSPFIIGGGNLDIEDVYLELYAANIVNIHFKYIHFDTTNLGQWIMDKDHNPDKKTYTCYKSSSNKGINSSLAKARITFQGYSSLTFYIRSYAETTWDYTSISKQNTALPAYSSTAYPGGSTAIPTTYIKTTTRGNQQSGYSNISSNWTAVSYTGLNENMEYYIEVGYSKDSSGHNNDDRGYILIPTPEPATPTETFRDVYIYFLLDNCVFYQIRLDFQGGYVDVLTSANAILYSTNVSQLQYNYEQFGPYFDPQKGGLATKYKQIAFAVGSSHPTTASKINMQYPILISQRGGPQIQWSQGYGITPSKLSYVNLTKAVYGRDGTLINLGNEVWYAVMTIDGVYTGL